MKTAFSVSLILAAIASTVAMYFFNTTAAVVQTAVLCLLVIIAGVMMFLKTRSIKGTVKKASKYFDNGFSGAAFPLPVILTDNEGEIVWYNDLFGEQVLGENIIHTDNISEFVGEFSKSLITESLNGFDIEYSGKKYTVFAEGIDNDKSSYCFFFVNDTELKNFAIEYKQTRPAVVQMKIDNLDEVYQNYKNSECEVISGELECILEAWASSYPCVFRKVSGGKYFMVVEERGLETLCEEKFNILRKVREYKYGENPIEITLSIGAGRGETMFECDENAKQALEMSQSRGGDQATVNTDGNLEFFGGIVGGSTKRTKIKARIIATAFSDHVKNSDAVFVTGHCFSDLDSIGSAVGIYAIVKALGKPCYILTDKDKCMAVNLVEALEEKGMKGAFVTIKEVKHQIHDKSLLVVVDTHRPDSLEFEETFSSFEKVIVIDHHRKTTNCISNAILFYDEPNASSACEMVTEMLQYVPAKVKLQPLFAEALLSGIMLDTRNFVLSTGARTFEAAAYLKSNGADTVAVKQLFANNFDNYKQKNAIISTAVTYKGCAVAIATDKAPEIRIIASQVADELLNVSGVKSSYVLFDENDQINISARSLGEMNVQVIMEKLGGGGHLTMAATQLKDTTMADAVVALENAINEYLS